MARIYNFMPESIVVLPGAFFVPTGGLIIEPGQRSESLDWPMNNTVTVWQQNNAKFVCVFAFGNHAQIQGGNYAVIQPGSYLVYDSNHDVINTGKG